MEVKDILKEGRPTEPQFEFEGEDAMERAAKVCCEYNYKLGVHDCYDYFEQNRLAHCEKLTEEEAQREEDFTLPFLKEYHRMPTFSDAIEVTRKQMVDKACKLLCDICYFDKNARCSKDFCEKCKAEGGDYWRFTKLAEE